MRLLGAKAKPATDGRVRLASKLGTNQVGELAIELLQAPLVGLFSLLLHELRAGIVVPVVDEGLGIGEKRRTLLAAQVSDRVTGNLVQPGPEVLALRVLRQLARAAMVKMAEASRTAMVATAATTGPPAAGRTAAVVGRHGHGGG